jgi:hypothetical protein
LESQLSDMFAQQYIRNDHQSNNSNSSNIALQQQQRQLQQQHYDDYNTNNIHAGSPPSPHVSNPYATKGKSDGGGGVGGGRRVGRDDDDEMLPRRRRRRPAVSNLESIAKCLSSSSLQLNNQQQKQQQQHSVANRPAIVRSLLESLNHASASLLSSSSPSLSFNNHHHYNNDNTVYLASILEPPALISSLSYYHDEQHHHHQQQLENSTTAMSCISSLLSTGIAIQVAQGWLDAGQNSDDDNSHTTSSTRCAFWLDATDPASMIDSYRQIMSLLRHNDDPNRMDISSTSHHAHTRADNDNDESSGGHMSKRRKVDVAQVAEEMYSILQEQHRSDPSFQCVLIYANVPDPNIFQEWFVQDASYSCNQWADHSSAGLAGILLATVHPSYDTGRLLGRLFPGITGIVQDAKMIEIATPSNSSSKDSGKISSAAGANSAGDIAETLLSPSTSSVLPSSLPSFWWERLPQPNLPPLFDYDEDSDSDDESERVETKKKIDFLKKLNKRLGKDGRILALTKSSPHDSSKSPSTNVVANRFARDWQMRESGNRFSLWMRSNTEHDLRQSYVSAIRRVTHTEDGGKPLPSLSGYSSLVVGSPHDLSIQSYAQELMDLFMHMREMSPTFQWLMIYSSIPEDAVFEEWFFSAASNWWNSRGRFLLTTSSETAAVTGASTTAKTTTTTTMKRPLQVQALNDEGAAACIPVRSLSVDV